MAGKKPWKTLRCRSCGSEYGWNGDYLDTPACPHCGYDMPESQKEELQRRFEEQLQPEKKRKKRKVAPKKSETETSGKKVVQRRKRKK